MVQSTPLSTPTSDLRKPPRKYMILSLDGGGVKGNSTLLLLRRLMIDVGKQQCKERGEVWDDTKIPKPCEYFDFIIGTSTGGLIAIMIGRLRMSVDECIKEYRHFSGIIFGKPRWFSVKSGFFLWERTKYSSKTLRRVIRDVVQRHGDSEFRSPDGSGPWNTFNQPQGSDGQFIGCKTAVFAQRQDKRGTNPFLFRSYDHWGTFVGEHPTSETILNAGTASTYPIVDVALATTAAPGYFRPVKLGKDSPDNAKYFDGAIQGNNPTTIAFQEGCSMALCSYPEISPSEAIAGVVSIGTGKSSWTLHPEKKRALPFKYLHMFRTQTKIIVDCENIHRAMHDRLSQHGIPYYRFNVEKGLENTRMDEYTTRSRRERIGDSWRVLEKMGTLQYLDHVTERYLSGKEYGLWNQESQNKISDKMACCAKLLVKTRDAQNRDTGAPGSATSFNSNSSSSQTDGSANFPSAS